MDTKDRIIDQLFELVNWLNEECPSVAPPLEPYNNSDLSHNFTELLRMRLDEINILKSFKTQLKEQEEKENEIDGNLGYGDYLMLGAKAYSDDEIKYKDK